jgi:hypothetical protein
MLNSLVGRLGLAVFACATLAGHAPATAQAVQAAQAPGLGVVSVSNLRPTLISGGQALVRITRPGRGDLQVRENGRSIAGFTRQTDGSLLGLVSGLKPGRNKIVARVGRHTAMLSLINHSISGPVFSGKQQHPFFCETTAFGLASASGPNCSAPTVVTYQYRTKKGAFAALPDPHSHPADLTTATVDGRTVPYVVRIETGTIDRAVYQTAALFDGRAPSPLRPETSWNGRLVYTFGGGCNGGYHQGNSTGGVLNDLFLSQGYAVASSSLNVLDNNCGVVTSAEAAMMVKEHFIETYGPVTHTIGWGGSGGAMQQHFIADAYPGILDGIVPGISFPDVFSLMKNVSDCRLLERYFSGPGKSVTAEQRKAVAGFLDYGTCVTADTAFSDRLTATDSCNKPLQSPGAYLPPSAIWDPKSNPTGVKCLATEQYANQFGRESDGFVRTPLDNTGVQYGLQALKTGQISAAQFVALNAGIGGLNAAGTPVKTRSQADQQALKAAYADDLVINGGLGLRTTPIIDQRTDMDTSALPLLNIHTRQWSFVTRARLLAANGTTANQVIIENGITPDQTDAASAYELTAMDQWLTTIEADHSGRSRQATVVASKPAGLSDGCYLSAKNRVQQPLTDPATGVCGTTYPVGSDPRQQSGAPQIEDALKCAPRPLDLTDYPVTFTKAETSELKKTFAPGVCDYSKPGAGQLQKPAAWRIYN